MLNKLNTIMKNAIKTPKKFKIGDTLKIMQSFGMYDVYDAEEGQRNNDLVYTVEIKAINKVKVTLE